MYGVGVSLQGVASGEEKPRTQKILSCFSKVDSEKIEQSITSGIDTKDGSLKKTLQSIYNKRNNLLYNSVAEVTELTMEDLVGYRLLTYRTMRDFFGTADEEIASRLQQIQRSPFGTCGRYSKNTA